VSHEIAHEVNTLAHDPVPFGTTLPSAVSVGSFAEAAEFSIDKDRRLVTVKFGPKTTIQTIEDYSLRLRAHPYFDSSFSEITDLREIEDLDLQADDFLKLADHVDPFSLEAKRAFVVRTSVQNHAARMHKILSSNRTIGIFRSVEEAERWVGLQLP
jgi:hypothetical protein